MSMIIETVARVYLCLSQRSDMTYCFSEDILVFMTGQEEIESAVKSIKDIAQDLSEGMAVFIGFNKIATQGTPQMAAEKEAISLSRVHTYYSTNNLPIF